MTDPKIEPPDWWDDFWKRDEENTGQSPEEAIEMLRRLRGETWSGLTHFKMKNPYGAGLSRLWATSEKSRKKPAPTTVWGSTA